MQQITIRAAFNLFIEDKERADLSPGTIQNARDVCGWLLKHYGHKAVKPQPFYDALVDFRNRRVKRSTLSMYYRTLNKFAKFCNQERYTGGPIELPSSPQPQIQHLSIEQLQTILTSFDLSKFTGLRNNAIVRFLFDSAIRRGEMLGIDDDGIDWTHNTAQNRGCAKYSESYPNLKASSYPPTLCGIHSPLTPC